MPVSKATNFGDSHVGLFARASDRLTVVDSSVFPKFLSALSALGDTVLKVSFSGSGLPGIFVAMNSNGAVLPSFCGKEELALFRKAGLNAITLSGSFSASGNNIAANDFGAIANPEIPRPALKRVSDCLGVEVVPMRLAGYLTVGSCVAATNRGFAAHNRASGQELKALQSILRVGGQNCTVNTGMPFVPLGVVANSRAAVLGEACTGFEAGRVAAALGLE